MSDAEIFGGLAGQQALGLAGHSVLTSDDKFHHAVGGEARGDGERSFDLGGRKGLDDFVRTMADGEGDAAAADIYASAYGRDTEFYSFFRGLQAYRRSLGKQGDILVLAPDGEFFKYLKDSGR